MSENTNRLSPRQKMINLMYIVLTAMLALNVSSDVLDGFTQVEQGLARTNANVEQRNAMLLNSLQAFAEQNPEKGRVWYEKGLEVRATTAQIYELIDSLKTRIIVQADGAEHAPSDIVNRDDLEAAAVVMLSPGNRTGEKLRLAVDAYRTYVTDLITDPARSANIESALSTEPIQRKGTINPQSWEEAKFDQQPVVAAVTMLTKLQNDILYAEGEVLSTLLANVDAGDIRVNELTAFVIPSSRMLMRGSRYQADIVIAAVDTTARPVVYVNGTKLAGSTYTATAGATGDFTYKGYIEVPQPDGSMKRFDFSSSYTVIEPMATVSATMMNVLYAGIDNPISISVPGVPMNAISATMTNGTLTRSGDQWIARPSSVGTDAVVTVNATIDGSSTQVASTTFRCRKLPDPTPYIPYTDAKGTQAEYKGGKPFGRGLLRQIDGLKAAIDDGILNVPFKVVSFQTIFFDSMGNAMPENSDGASFSQRQRQQIQRLQSGKRFFITNIKASGPDGITRDLSPIEVIVGS